MCKANADKQFGLFRAKRMLGNFFSLTLILQAAHGLTRAVVPNSMKTEIQTILFFQQTAIRFNEECLQLLIKDESYRDKRVADHRGYGLLILMSKQYLILNLFKLMHHKEGDSIPALIRDLNPSVNKKILTLYHESRSIFKEQRIKEIRDQHVAHLDTHREKEAVNWNKIRKLNQNLDRLINLYIERVLKEKYIWNLPETTLLDLYEGLILKIKDGKKNNWAQQQINARRLLSLFGRGFTPAFRQAGWTM